MEVGRSRAQSEPDRAVKISYRDFVKASDSSVVGMAYKKGAYERGSFGVWKSRGVMR